ncbi:MAG: polyphenol oxidase family protein [Candidatus Omnitrophota bacterium]|nr:polyphenol oxidase family protein [Candidatus Omnitrophota bacterium]
MAVAATETSVLREDSPGLWRFDGWGPAWVTGGVAGRPADLTRLSRHLPKTARLVQADQVHGSSIAVIQHVPVDGPPVAGCDALLTSLRKTALVIRTADCVPLFFLDPVRRVIGIAHAGWRGLAAGLPLKLLAMLRHAYQSRPQDVRVAIGPAIRSCCYDVGPEFAPRFGSFVQERAGRRTCDLIGAAIEQLQRGGIHQARITDTQQCTACAGGPWFSIRREGQGTGRLLSFLMIR